jgi:hypothetical protein
VRRATIRIRRAGPSTDRSISASPSRGTRRTIRAARPCEVLSAGELARRRVGGENRAVRIEDDDAGRQCGQDTVQTSARAIRLRERADESHVGDLEHRGATLELASNDGFLVQRGRLLREHHQPPKLPGAVRTDGSGARVERVGRERLQARLVFVENRSRS